MRLLVLISLAAIGCGKAPTVPVSGRVTLDGQPLEGASVLFQPVVADANADGFGSVGQTDADGRFELKAIGLPHRGAIPGSHRVYISKPLYPPNGEYVADIPNAIPDEYHTGDGISFEVPTDGTIEAAFDLVTPKRARRK